MVQLFFSMYFKLCIHILDNLMKIRNNNKKQKKGIPKFGMQKINSKMPLWKVCEKAY